MSSAAEILIRKAVSSDRDAIARHNIAMALETESITLDADVVQAGVEAALNDCSKGFYLVGENRSDGKVVANLMITFEWSDWRNRQMWWFQSVYVCKEFRKTGVFRRMSQHVKDLASQNGVRDLRLYVERTNTRAQSAYRAIGMDKSHYDMFEIEL